MASQVSEGYVPCNALEVAEALLRYFRREVLGPWQKTLVDLFRQFFPEEQPADAKDLHVEGSCENCWTVEVPVSTATLLHVCPTA